MKLVIAGPRREKIAWRAMQEEQAEKRKAIAREEARAWIPDFIWFHWVFGISNALKTCEALGSLNSSLQSSWIRIHNLCVSVL